MVSALLFEEIVSGTARHCFDHQAPKLSTKLLSEPRNGPNFSRSTISSTNIGITCRSSHLLVRRNCRPNGEPDVTESLRNEDTPFNRSGTVESRIRQLVMKLEYVESLTLAHPFIKGFEQVSYCLVDDEVRAVAQGEISEAVAKRKKEDIEGKEGASTVYSTSFYIGLAISPKQRTSSHLRYDISVGMHELISPSEKRALRVLGSWTFRGPQPSSLSS